MLAKYFKHNQNEKYYFFTFLVSIVSMFAQVGYLRLSARVFHGNELTVGIITGHWLIWTSIGSFVGTKLINRYSSKKLLTIISFLYGIVLIVFSYLLYLIRTVLNISNSTILGTGVIFVIIFFTIAIPTILNGILFPLLVDFIKSRVQKAQTAVIYSADTFGAALGAIFFALLLISGILTLQNIHIIVGLLYIFSSFLFLNNLKKRYVILFVSILLLTVSGLFWVKQATILRWQPMQIQEAYETPYQSIIRANYQGKKVIYGNGEVLPLGGNKKFAEELIHFPMLSHSSPDSILFIGNIDSTIHSEIKEYKQVEHLTILNEDKKLQQSIYPLSSSNEDLRYINGDPFTTFSKLQHDYDVIILNISRPINILWNRYYTRKFFKKSQNILSSQGIISLSLPGGENYLSEEQLRFMKIISNTVKTAFDKISWIPGETVHLIAGNQKIETDYDSIVQKLSLRNIKNKYVTDYYLVDRLSQMKRDFLHQNLKSIEESSINTLLNPLAFYFNTILQEQKNKSFLASIYKKLRSVESFWIIIIVPTFIILGFLISGRTKVTIFTMGIVGFYHMILENLLVILFQSYIGALYLKITFLLFSFMIGAGTGALYYRYIDKDQGGKFILGLFLLPILIYFIIKFNLYLFLFFPILLFIAGFLDGYLFPYLLQKYQKQSQMSSGSSAGKIYSADVLGSCLGSYLFSIFLLPIWGVNISLVILTILGCLLLIKKMIYS